MMRATGRARAVALAAGLLLAAAGCGGGDGGGEASSQTAIAAADRAEADEIFGKRCAACHGTSGMGDGPGAMALSPKPRNYRDRAWQKSVKDEEIEKAIVYGGAAVGKSPQMVANPDLQAKPGVVAALRVKIREFGRM